MSTPAIKIAKLPDSYAAEKIENFPMNPLVNGIPAKASKKKANVEATIGERLPSPLQRLRSVTSPLESRINETIANPPTVATPYAKR